MKTRVVSNIGGEELAEVVSCITAEWNRNGNALHAFSGGGGGCGGGGQQYQLPSGG